MIVTNNNDLPNWTVTNEVFLMRSMSPIHISNHIFNNEAHVYSQIFKYASAIRNTVWQPKLSHVQNWND